jgi:adenylate cyclase
VVGGLRQLVVRTRAIESGTDSEPLSILTRDEVGELALSFNRMIEELRSRERIKDTFGKFVDPRIVTRLIGSGAEQAERRTLTIFFSDIKDFSGISEQLTASAVVNLLNSYFGTVADVIHAHHGFIDKYIGDAVMAFWVSPFSAGDDHASDACLAALAQQEAITLLRAQLPEITGMRRNPHHACYPYGNRQWRSRGRDHWLGCGAILYRDRRYGEPRLASRERQQTLWHLAHPQRGDLSNGPTSR